MKQWLHRIGEQVKRLWDMRHRIGHEVKHKQRFVVMDTVTFKEKWSFQLSAINVFVAVGVSMIVLVVLTTVLIAFTPLREFIPGYANQRMTEQTYQNAYALDSLALQLEQQERMLADLQDLMAGRDPSERHRDDDTATEKREAKPYAHSAADSALRREVEGQDRYSVAQRAASTEAQPMETVPTILLFTPLKGKVIGPYDERQRHYGVDIAGAMNQAIKACAPGTVVFANYTIETGYVIALQHQGGMMSVYKHNAALLKQEGDVVRAGEPIAYLGNTGELTTGPHLHFELWVKGKPVNPQTFISF